MAKLNQTVTNIPLDLLRARISFPYLNELWAFVYVGIKIKLCVAVSRLEQPSTLKAQKDI